MTDSFIIPIVEFSADFGTTDAFEKLLAGFLKKQLNQHGFSTNEPDESCGWLIQTHRSGFVITTYLKTEGSDASTLYRNCKLIHDLVFPSADTPDVQSIWTRNNFAKEFCYRVQEILSGNPQFKDILWGQEPNGNASRL